MTDRKGFNFYKSYWEQIKLLNDNQKLELFNTICRVQFLEEDINDINFTDNILNIVWAGMKHSVSTSLNGFVSKQKSLGKDVILPLTKGGSEGLTKGGAQQVQGKEEEKEKGKGKEEYKYSIEREILNNVSSLFDKTYYNTESKKTKWLDTIRLLLNTDKYNKQTIIDSIKFARSDEFWQSNLLTINSLRKKNKEGIMKIESIIAKMPGQQNALITTNDPYKGFKRL